MKELLRSCPFYDTKEQQIRFSLRPLNGIVFIWPLSIDKVGSIFLPEDETFIKSFKESVSGYGIILNAPRQYRDRKGRIHSIDLRPGDLVIYSTKIPKSWKNLTVTSPVDGKDYKVVYCSFMDVYLRVLGDEKF